ncbi:MAG: hypothetical protein V4808_16090 [Pseudomonadota bacterium]
MMLSTDHGWYVTNARKALDMARAYRSTPHMRVIWQERAADYRECLVYGMRRRQGWTLPEIIAGKREG